MSRKKGSHVDEDLFSSVVSCGVTAAQCGASAAAAVLLAAECPHPWYKFLCSKFHPVTCTTQSSELEGSLLCCVGSGARSKEQSGCRAAGTTQGASADC